MGREVYKCRYHGEFVASVTPAECRQATGGHVHCPHRVGTRKGRPCPYIPVYKGSERVAADWRCPCGNIPESSGFVTCTREGMPVEPLAGGDWDGIHNRCMECGRVIDQHTLLVVRGPLSKAEPCIGCGATYQCFSDCPAIPTW